MNHKKAAQTAPEVKTDAQTTAQADAAVKEQERIARYDQEIKDLTERLKTATEANAELEDDFTNGIRGEITLVPRPEDGPVHAMGFKQSTMEVKPTSTIRIRDRALLDEPMVLTLNRVALVEDGFTSAVEYLFGNIDDLETETKTLFGYRLAKSNLPKDGFDYALPEVIQINPIDPKEKKRTSTWAGAVTGSFRFQTAGISDPLYVSVTAKKSDRAKDSGTALTAIETQSKHAPSRSVVELIDYSQTGNLSGVELATESYALIVLKLRGYKIIGSYLDRADSERTQEKVQAAQKRALSEFEKRTDKVEVIEDIEIINTREIESEG